MLKTFECKQCGISFGRKVYPSYPSRDFCSASCRNKARALTKIPCPTCGNPFSPKKGKESIRRKFCSQECAWSSQINATSAAGQQRWTKERDDVLRQHYPSRGASYCADILGVAHGTILSRVCILKLTLTKQATRRIVNLRASEYMKTNNPMFQDATKKKVLAYYKKNPQEHERKMRALFSGHQRLQKGNPTKLELKLFFILEGLGVAHESFATIKPKFIVDAKIDNLIIQADGDYWHGHERFHPLTDRQKAQRKRDAAQDKYLRACGYAVERVWECEMSIDIVRHILEKHKILPSP